MVIISDFVTDVCVGIGPNVGFDSKAANLFFGGFDDEDDDEDGVDAKEDDEEDESGV
jgi:hypothetical protein